MSLRLMGHQQTRQYTHHFLLSDVAVLVAALGAVLCFFVAVLFWNCIYLPKHAFSPKYSNVKQFAPPSLAPPFNLGV